eukprot:636383-Rhodomonas_salina.3
MQLAQLPREGEAIADTHRRPGQSDGSDASRLLLAVELDAVDVDGSEKLIEQTQLSSSPTRSKLL